MARRRNAAKWSAVLLLLHSTTACSFLGSSSSARLYGGAPASLGYIGPSTTAAPIRALVAEDDAADVRQTILAAAGAVPGASAQLSEDGSVVVVTYSGDPENFVDCGAIVTSTGSGAIETVPAARARASFANTNALPGGRVDRQMRLDARVVYHVTSWGQDRAQVRVASTYLITKELSGLRTSAGTPDVVRETVAFRFGESGEFDKGTICRATGQLEQAFLRGIVGRRGDLSA